MNAPLPHITLFLYACSALTVFVTAHIPGFENSLKFMTRENGFFEWVSVFLLFAIAAMALSALSIKRDRLGDWTRIALIILALTAFVAAMEEISWGQHLLHFESPEYFNDNNRQQETNLHNFIHPELFASLIYSSVYTVFVFLPLSIRALAPGWAILDKLVQWLPSLHISLVVLFGSAFQIYFYENFGVITDFATLVAALIFFALVVSYRQLWTPLLAQHFLWIVLAMGLMMSAYESFSFFNRQYEIREAFVVLATLTYLNQLIARIVVVNAEKDPA